jgi:hypothetical protein
MDIWSSVAWFFLLTVVLIALKREVQKALFGLSFRLTAGWRNEDRRRRTAVIAHYVLMWPGILVHESSHWLMALLLGARPTPPQIQLRINRSSIELGSVATKKVGALRGSLIGAAPLLGGTVAVLLLANLAFGISLTPDRSAVEGLAHVLANLDRYARAADAWVWVYFIFAISNSMLPSPADRQEWGRVLVVLVLVSAGVVVVVGVPRMPHELADALRRVIDTLSFGFGLTILVDVFVLALLLAADTSLAVVQNRS